MIYTYIIIYIYMYRVDTPGSPLVLREVSTIQHRIYIDII